MGRTRGTGFRVISSDRPLFAARRGKQDVTCETDLFLSRDVVQEAVLRKFFYFYFRSVYIYVYIDVQWHVE